MGQVVNRKTIQVFLGSIQTVPKVNRHRVPPSAAWCVAPFP
jgi:hypothetical protein